MGTNIHVKKEIAKLIKDEKCHVVFLQELPENITQENSHMTIYSEKDEQPKIQICCEDTSIGEYPVMIVYGLHYEHNMVITYDILRTRYIAQVNLYHYAYINTSKGSDTTQVVFDETDLENYKDLVGYGSNYMLVLGNEMEG